MDIDFPSDPAALAALQDALRAAAPPAWAPPPAGTAALVVGGCFVVFPRGGVGEGAAGDEGHAGAALVRAGQVVATAVVAAPAGAPYAAGFLAAREGPLLASAVRALPERPAVLLVNATGRDHPRRAGLAVHLGAALDLPTVGVTHRPLFAVGAWPPDVAGATAPLLLDGEEVGRWLRPAAGLRPLAVHAAWRTTPAVAVTVVAGVLGQARTPLPLRAAREAARTARAGVNPPAPAIPG